MNLADKIIQERKKLGLSQEEFAEQLSVSRQAVSKWESAQSVPDLQKIIAMSKLFSVSTDYLLKSDVEQQKPTLDVCKSDCSTRRISVEEATEFLSVMQAESKTVALGVLLCILCPVLLIFLVGFAKLEVCGISDTLAVTVGLVALFVFVAIAVYLFIRHGIKLEKFEHLKTDEFETAYGVLELVKEKKERFEPTFTKYLSLGIILCVLSPLPLVITAVIGGTNVIITSMTALLLCIVSIGVYMIIRVAMVKSSYQILLQEGDYEIRKKKNSAVEPCVSGVYWCFVVAVYLVWSFVSNNWKITWIVWLVAGLLFAPITLIIKQLCNKNNK